MKTTETPTHTFIWDGIPPGYDNKRWCTCRRLESHSMHAVPPRDPDEIETEARILGEHQEE